MAINKGYLTAKTDKESDETYTPAYAVIPLIKHLHKYRFHSFPAKASSELIIWCPFDTEESEYVKVFKSSGFQVISSHIDEGKNFFEYEPERYDIIISNPPFSIKDMVLKRLYELNKPYAMLLPLPTLQGERCFPYLKDCQALIFNKRINFYRDSSRTEIQKGVAFVSIYICKNFLSKDLIFESLELS